MLYSASTALHSPRGAYHSSSPCLKPHNRILHDECQPSLARNMLSRQQIDRLRADIRFTAELGGRNLVFHSAVRYSNRNAQLSNGFAQIDPDLRFNLIASNLPAKVGSELISIYLHDAHDRLRAGRRLSLSYHQRVAAVSEAQPDRGLRQL